MAEAPDDLSRQQAEGGHIPNIRELDQLHVATVWYRLGLQLGVKAEDLDVIEKDYPRETDMCKVKMFAKWLRSDTNPNYETLIKALAVVGKRKLAESVCDDQGISRSVLDAMGAVKLHQSSEVMESDVVAAAKASIRQLQDEYEVLVAMTREVIKAKATTLTELQDKVTLRLPEPIRSELQPVLKENLSYIYGAKSIDEVIGIFNLCIWNYLNYGLLQHLVEVYGEGKLLQRMQKYDLSVESFRRNTTLKTFWKASPGIKCPDIPSNLREGLKKITFKHGKLDANTSLDTIEQHRKDLARYFSLPDFTVILADIESGCVATVWLVPASVAAKLADEVQSEKVDFFEQLNILELQVQDSTVYHSIREISLSDLEFGDQLGEGAFGVVYKGHWKSRDMDVAIKRMYGRINKEETKILSQLRHPHIIQFYGVVHVVDRPGPPEHYIVTELAEGGSLYDLLYKKNYKPSQEESMRWATQIAQGIQYEIRTLPFLDIQSNK